MFIKLLCIRAVTHVRSCCTEYQHSISYDITYFNYWAIKQLRRISQDHFDYKYVCLFKNSHFLLVFLMCILFQLVLGTLLHNMSAEYIFCSDPEKEQQQWSGYHLRFQTKELVTFLNKVKQSKANSVTGKPLWIAAWQDLCSFITRTPTWVSKLSGGFSFRWS